MAGATASVTLNVRTILDGYQEQINKLKADLSKVGENSDLGKKLKADLAAVEKQLKSMSGVLDKTFTSQGQIDAFESKLMGILSHIASIGERMQDLDIGDLAEADGLAQATQELATMQKELANLKKSGLKEILNTDEVIAGLKAIGVNAKSIHDAAEGAQRFADGIDEIRQKAQQASDEVASLGEQASAVQAEINALNERQALLQKGRFHSENTGMAKTVFAAVNDKTKGDAIVNAIKNWGSLQDAAAKDSGLKSIFEQIQNAPTDNLLKIISLIQQLEERLKQLKASEAISSTFKNVSTVLAGDAATGVTREGGLASQQLLREGIELAKNDSKLQKAFSASGIDVKQITDEQWSKILGEEELSGVIARIREVIKQQFAEIPQTVAALSTEKDKLDSQVEEKKNEANDFVDKGKVAAEGQKAFSDKTGDLNKTVQQLEQTIANQQQQITELRAQLANSSTLPEVKGAGAEHIAEASDKAETLRERMSEVNKEMNKVNTNKESVNFLNQIITRWFSVHAAIRMVTRGVKDMVSTIKELDKTMTQIAIVTDMSQEDLWAQMPTYTAAAKEFAVSISGVYQVSQLFYQQGLQTADVMKLTNETLKMAKISGLAYADAANYMTNAIRSFKMESSDAQKVVDVYSALSAKAATDTKELAIAMSKTASSAESVGASFENTSAMMTVMIEATRESSQNIGSALKSIISRLKIA